MGNKKKGKILAVLLSGTLLGAQMPGMTVAEGAAGYTGGICEHHPVHTAECGYQAAVPEQPCRHEHTKECYEYETSCVHVHTEECYPLIAIEVPAGDQDTEGTAKDAGTAETELVRGPEPTACTHVCSEDSGCVTKNLNCIHEDKVNADGSITYAVHDASCGYAPAVEGKECTFVCEICSAPEEKGIELISLSETEALTVRTGIAAAGSADSEPSAKTTEAGDEGADEDETDSETETSTEETTEAGPEGTESEETDSETEISTEKTTEAGPEGTEAEETDSETEISTEKTTEAGPEGTDEDETDSETETSTGETPDPDAETETNEAVPDEAVASVQAMIEALPSVEKVEKMTPEEQKEIYNDAQDAADAYFDELTDEQQEQVDLKKLMDLMDYFNGQVSTMDTVVATVTINGNTTTYTDLKTALNAAGASGTTAMVTLMQNVTLRTGTNIEIYGNVTFVGGDYAVTGKFEIDVYSGGTFTVESGTLNSGGYAGLCCNGGTIIVNGGSMDRVGYGYGAAGTIKINGGNIDTLSRIGSGTITINGGTIGKISGNSGSITYNPPAETVSIESVSAGKIKVTPLSNTTTFGGAQYSLDGTNWQSSNELNCKADTSYIVYARYSNATTKIWSTAAKSSAASYTVSIPSATLTAGDSTSTAEISVDTSENFDLGYGGEVQVKVKSGINGDGNLTMTRQGASDTLTSVMYVNGSAFTNITQPVATFTMNDYNSAEAVVSFAQPKTTDTTQTVIPAGTYSGTVTFEVTYSEQ